MRNEITTKLISFEDILSAECVRIDEIIEIIEKSFVAYKNGKIILPEKISQVFDEKSQNRINCMPTTLIEENVCGMKWVSVFPNNPQIFNCQNISGVIILSSLENGFPIAIMDGAFITALRTACVGATAAKHLANKNSKVYATIGTGEQAKMHFITIKNQIPSIKVCKVASRKSESEKRFIDEMKKRYPEVDFIALNSDFDKVAKDADIIVTAVSCQAPLLRANNIKEGAFYCHVGGWEDEYEVPLKANKIVCDSWEAVKHRTQTISRLFKQGILSDSDIYSDIADIIDKTVPGRENETEFIYFNSVGLAFLDVAIANDIYKKAVSKGKFKEWTIQNTSFLKFFN